MRFYFSEVDVELSGWEFLRAILLGIAICALPFAVKFLIGFIF